MENIRKKCKNYCNCFVITDDFSSFILIGRKGGRKENNIYHIDLSDSMFLLLKLCSIFLRVYN